MLQIAYTPNSQGCEETWLWVIFISIPPFGVLYVRKWIYKYVSNLSKQHIFIFLWIFFTTNQAAVLLPQLLRRHSFPKYQTYYSGCMNKEAPLPVTVNGEVQLWSQETGAASTKDVAWYLMAYMPFLRGKWGGAHNPARCLWDRHQQICWQENDWVNFFFFFPQVKFCYKSVSHKSFIKKIKWGGSHSQRESYVAHFPTSY